MGNRLQKDFVGKKFNYLTVIKYIGDSKWECMCDCGTTTLTTSPKLKTGHTKSCGCIAKTNALKHGMKGTKEYNIWNNMKARCQNPNAINYNRYGKRGITVCKQWSESFENFYSDMGNCPIGHSIERIDNSKGYSKNNCKWATNTEQSFNRRSNSLVTFNGETKPLKLFCDQLGKNYKTVFARISKLQWSVEEALLIKTKKS